MQRLRVQLGNRSRAEKVYAGGMLNACCVAGEIPWLDIPGIGGFHRMLLIMGCRMRDEGGIDCR